MMANLAQRLATAARRPVAAVGIVLASVATATAVQAGLQAALAAPPAFMVFYPALIFATVVAGARGGSLALVLSAFVAPLLWPVEARAGASLPVSMGLFLATGALIVAIAKPLRVAIQRGAAVQARFRIAQEAARDAFTILDPIVADGDVVDFLWTYANPAAQRMAPRGVDNLVGRRVLDVFPDETGQAMVARLREALSRTEPDDREVRRIIDGEERWVRSSAVRIDHGVAATFRDITDERAAAQALRSGEARVRAVLESLPQLMWVSRTSGDWIYVSPQWTDFTGADGAEPLGRGWLAAVHPDDQEMVARAWDRAIAEEEAFEPEFRLRRADGAWRWMSGRASPLRDEDGGVRRWFGSASDVTEVVEARQDLEARVAERTRELKASLEARARTEAALAQAQRLETVGRLTGGIAHDFNNLLMVIIGGLDMILKDPANLPRVTKVAHAALAAGRRGERLTRQLLAFSRRQELRPDNLAVGKLISQIEPLVRRAAGEAIDLTIDCPPEVGAARLDAAQFEAALLNLVVNAADATAPGGRIAISARRVSLAGGEVRGAPAGDYVRLSVADTGEGMSPEVLEHVFEPFFTTKETGKGTGLGLAQVYGFVSQCGGAVDIRSAPGEGAEITLYLPAAETEDEEEDEPLTGESMGGLRVLLVEDDDAVRGVTESLLSDLGCEVVSSVNAAAALERLEAGERFDLILSDIVMPGGVSGVELAQRVRRDYPDMPIVLTTGYGGDRLAEANETNGWPVLRKPFRADQLGAVMRQVLAANAA